MLTSNLLITRSAMRSVIRSDMLATLTLRNLLPLSSIFLSMCCVFVAAMPATGRAVTQSLATNALSIGNGGEPETLDPHRYNLRLEETILSDLFLGLTTFDAHGKTIPGAAERWDISTDGLTWTFHLRPNLKWSDGVALTAEDFVYALRRTVDPKTAASLAYFLYPIANANAVNSGKQLPEALGVKALNGSTLVIRLANPDPFFAERLMYPTGYPVPKHLIDKLGDSWAKAGTMVSNGAYTLTEWVPHGHITLKKNPRFYDAGNVHIDQVVYYPTDDELAAFNQFRAGELNAIGSFPSGQLDAMRATQPKALRLSPLLSIMYLVFNVTSQPFNDVRVREALAIAIDRDILTSKVMRTGEVPQFSFVPSLVENYQAEKVGHSKTPRAERLARARALLAQAGFGPTKPLKLQLRYISGNDNKKVHVAIAAMWKDIGVETELFHSELKVHFAELREGQFQVAQAGWFGENNPGHYLSLLRSGTGNVNYGRFSSTQYDSLMNQADRTAALPARLALYQQAEALAMKELPVIPLYAVMIRSLVDPRITGWVDNARNVHNVRWLGWRAR